MNFELLEKVRHQAVMFSFDFNKLENVTLEISQILYKCQIWRLKKYHRTGGLISFSGYYPPGSAGSDDAKFIQWKIEEFCDCSFPEKIDGLVVDCRQLDYVWGDDLSFYPTRHFKGNFPVLIVINPAQHEAFAGILSEAVIRFELQSTLEEMNQFFRSMKAKL